MKKYIYLISYFFCSTAISFAGSVTITPLEPLPGMPGTVAVSDYINTVYKLMLGAAVVLAIFKITVGGGKMILSASSPSKIEDGKADIQDAIWGLVLAFASYIILQQIDPSLILGN